MSVILSLTKQIASRKFRAALTTAKLKNIPSHPHNTGLTCIRCRDFTLISWKKLLSTYTELFCTSHYLSLKTINTWKAHTNTETQPLQTQQYLHYSGGNKQLSGTDHQRSDSITGSIINTSNQNLTKQWGLSLNYCKTCQRT